MILNTSLIMLPEGEKILITSLKRNSILEVFRKKNSFRDETFSRCIIIYVMTKILFSENNLSAMQLPMNLNNDKYHLKSLSLSYYIKKDYTLEDFSKRCVMKDIKSKHIDNGFNLWS